MDEKIGEGKVDEVKGHIKEGAGGLTGDRDLQREGRVDELKGKAKEAFGNLREGVKGALDSLGKKK